MDDESDIQKLAAKLLTLVADDEALIEFVKDSPHYEKGNHEAPIFTEAFLYNLLGKDKAREVLSILEVLLSEAGVDVKEARRVRTPEEIFYDEEIAPTLVELCKKCSDKGMPFMAVVEYNPNMQGGYGSTTQAKRGMSVAMGVIFTAIHCNGNVDQLISKIVELAGDNHTSVFLTMLKDQKLSDWGIGKFSKDIKNEQDK